MRTPDEIKKGLERCIIGECPECPYERVCDEYLEEGGSSIPTEEPLTDFLALIQQIERERDAIEDDFAYMVSCLDINCLPKACEFCMHHFPGYACHPCKFAWRGVQEVDV